MNITKKTRLAIGVVGLSAAVGLAAGGAFTGGGVTNNAPANQFIGGTVSQTVTGATLSTIGYTYTNDAHTIVDTVTLTFADANADGRTPTVTILPTPSTAFVCLPISGSHVSVCTGVVSNITHLDVILGDYNP